jgi:predicted MFS family arabinose efflux permease
MMALMLQSVALKLLPGEYARPVFLSLIFIQGIGGWMFYPGQVANLVQVEPQAPMIALSLNASAMYLGFAIGGALGGIVLTGLSPADLGWVGGCGVAAALAGLLLRRRQPRLKTA